MSESPPHGRTFLHTPTRPRRGRGRSSSRLQAPEPGRHPPARRLSACLLGAVLQVRREDTEGGSPERHPRGPDVPRGAH